MILAIDTETTGSDFWHGCKPFMVQMCTGKANYVWSGEVNPEDRREVTWSDDDLEEIQEYIDNADTIVFHNAKFDIRALERIGVECKQWDKINDTMIAAHLCCSGDKLALKYLAYKYLDYDNDNEQKLKASVVAARANNKELDLAKVGHSCFPGLPNTTKWYALDYWLCIEECAEYGYTDTEMTWLLWRMFDDVIHARNLEEQYETRRQLLEITYEMEDTGIHMYETGDNGVEQQIANLEVLKSILYQQIHKENNLGIELDLSKPNDQRFFLFDLLKIPIIFKTEKSNEASVNKDSLDYYIKKNPEIVTLAHFRDYLNAESEQSKLRTYQKWRCADGRIRSSMVITGTRETRQSSKSPNTQNIKKSLRGIYGPEPGYVWLDYDLVNIEMRIWAYQVNNKELTDIFDHGGSVHMLIAQILYPDLCMKCQEEGLEFKKEYKETFYQWIKNGNFSIIYGAGEAKADATYRVPGAYATVVNRFPEVPQYTRSVINEVLENEERYGIPYLTCVGGYPLEVPLDSLNNKACNYKAQGSAGYIINHAMINVYRNPLYKSHRAKIINQIHDSIVVEVPLENNTEELRESIKRSIEVAGERFIPTCEAEYEEVLNPVDTPF